jgi:hypothetical protein
VSLGRLRNLVAQLHARPRLTARCCPCPCPSMLRPTKGLPNEVPGAEYPRSGVAMGVGVVCDSDRTGKTDAKTRVEWSMAEVRRSPASQVFTMMRLLVESSWASKRRRKDLHLQDCRIPHLL